MKGSDIAFGDTVRVRDTSVTALAGLAGLVGTVRGETKPSVTRIDVIGDLAKDHAVKVYFEDRDRDYWLDPSLLAHLGEGNGPLPSGPCDKAESAETGQRRRRGGPARRWWKFW